MRVDERRADSKKSNSKDTSNHDSSASNGSGFNANSDCAVHGHNRLFCCDAGHPQDFKHSHMTYTDGNRRPIDPELSSATSRLTLRSSISRARMQSRSTRTRQQQQFGVVCVNQKRHSGDLWTSSLDFQLVPFTRITSGWPVILPIKHDRKAPNHMGQTTNSTVATLLCARARVNGNHNRVHASLKSSRGPRGISFAGSP